MWPPEARPLLGGAAGEGPGTAGRGWRDAVPGKSSWLPVRKELPSRAPELPMCSFLGSGPVAAVCAAVPLSLGATSSGGGWDSVRRERKRQGGPRASGRGAGVWQMILIYLCSSSVFTSTCVSKGSQGWLQLHMISC